MSTSPGPELRWHVAVLSRPLITIYGSPQSSTPVPGFRGSSANTPDRFWYKCTSLDPTRVVRKTATAKSIAVAFEASSLRGCGGVIDYFIATTRAMPPADVMHSPAPPLLIFAWRSQL
ncbi:hypothetical protein DICSQDRAFT_171689 [Dichomitus squalens LYAD-421 SS1]|uniref:Uncharacterized protein n=1 Tax=Dichomitus squalens (strain LYAD-421) TaxID=732165 RepID=R7SXM2_DICSQ|nr:uncharacterized protein DICSQDRAFT_171689 [Dichomitus squalens LYAD-421 SS1]EJF59722.1 hypothetical protein DICSQDRAFT_171689 [Dichomitus squalens LYAD-421 SS1]